MYVIPHWHSHSHQVRTVNWSMAYTLLIQDGSDFILALCRIYASWKTALISLVTHICVANPSIYLGCTIYNYAYGFCFVVFAVVMPWPVLPIFLRVAFPGVSEATLKNMDQCITMRPQQNDGRENKCLTHRARMTHECFSLSLVLIMAWRLFGAKSLSQPMLLYCIHLRMTPFWL